MVNAGNAGTRQIRDLSTGDLSNVRIWNPVPKTNYNYVHARPSLGPRRPRPLECTHSDHKERAGGSKDANDTWNSAAAAVYPAELNLTIAYAIASLRSGISEPSLLPKISKQAMQERVTEFEREERADQRLIQRLSSMSSHLTSPNPNQLTQPPPRGVHTPVAPPSRVLAPATPLHPGRARELDLPSPIIEESRPPTVQRMQDIPTPNRPDVISARVRRRRTSLSFDEPNKDGNGSVLLLSSNDSSDSDKADPKNHLEAMKDDKMGWTAAENKELDNHKSNGSFQLMDRTDFEREAPGRRLVKLVWVYKRKRNGQLKARL